MLKIVPTRHGISQIIHIPIYIFPFPQYFIKTLSLVFSSGVREDPVSPINKNIIAHQYHLSAITKLFRFFATHGSSFTYPQLCPNCLKKYLEVTEIKDLYVCACAHFTQVSICEHNEHQWNAMCSEKYSL